MLKKYRVYAGKYSVLGSHKQICFSILASLDTQAIDKEDALNQWNESFSEDIKIKLDMESLKIIDIEKEFPNIIYKPGIYYFNGLINE